MTIRSQFAYETRIQQTVAAGLAPVADYLANASGYGEGESVDFARGVAWAVGMLHGLRERAAAERSRL